MVAKRCSSIPLVVDLDGTLLTTDSLWESLLEILVRRPSKLFSIPGWLGLGRTGFKARVAESTQIDFSHIPFNETLLELIQSAKSEGRPVVLATASHFKAAEAVARHLGVFDSIIASDLKTNLKGKEKARALVDRYGEKCFDYAGDSISDVEVWRYSRTAYVAGGNSLALKAQVVCKDVIVIEDPSSSFKTLLQALRIHQWVKNLLIFVPLILSHSFFSSEVSRAVIAFFSFSLCASATYLINDILDIRVDRRHPSKSKRPIASGRLGIPGAFMLIFVCFFLGFSSAWFLPAGYLLPLIGYLATTLLYSLWAKRVVMLDTIILSCLYSLRLLAGGEAVQVEVSYWLLGFSFFIFLCLALVKRIVEVVKLHQKGNASLMGRGYLPEDLSTLRCMASASSGCAILTLALYIGTDIAQKEYNDPRILIILCPLMAYWLGRLLILADRGKVDDDPIYFAIKDRISYVVALIVCVIFLYASYI